MASKKTTTDEPDPRITKRRVTMRRARLRPGADPVNDPQNAFAIDEAIDYVRPDFLDAYVAEARTRWDSVDVSEEPDAGPAGYHGATAVPARLNHPLAGQVFPATSDKED